jgi:tryptophan-rich sensory protein
MSNIFKLIISIIICEGVGIVAGIATSKSIGDWYQFLNKPSFNPPGWIFGPVWTVLYLMMGIAFFLVWKEGLDIPGVKTAMIFFIIHLLLNGLWSFVFFLWRSPGPAFIVIIALWIMIFICIILFNKISVTASLLLVPYLLWVSFASVLNFNIWKLN